MLCCLIIDQNINDNKMCVNIFISYKYVCPFSYDNQLCIGRDQILQSCDDFHSVLNLSFMGTPIMRTVISCEWHFLIRAGMLTLWCCTSMERGYILDSSKL